MCQVAKTFVRCLFTKPFLFLGLVFLVVSAIFNYMWFTGNPPTDNTSMIIFAIVLGFTALIIVSYINVVRSICIYYKKKEAKETEAKNQNI